MQDQCRWTGKHKEQKREGTSPFDNFLCKGLKSSVTKHCALLRVVSKILLGHQSREPPSKSFLWKGQQTSLKANPRQPSCLLHDQNAKWLSWWNQRGALCIDWGHKKNGRLLTLTSTVLTHLSFIGGTPLQKSNSTKVSFHPRSKKPVHTSLGMAKPSDQLDVVVCCICLSLSIVHHSSLVSFRGLGLMFCAVTVKHKEYHSPVSQWTPNVFLEKI